MRAFFMVLTLEPIVASTKGTLHWLKFGRWRLRSAQTVLFKTSAERHFQSKGTRTERWSKKNFSWRFSRQTEIWAVHTENKGCTLYLDGNRTMCLPDADCWGFNCDFKINKIEKTWTVDLHTNPVENKHEAGISWGNCGIFVWQAKTAATEKMKTKISKLYIVLHYIGPVFSFSTSRKWCALSLDINAKRTNLLFTYISIRLRH